MPKKAFRCQDSIHTSPKVVTTLYFHLTHLRCDSSHLHFTTQTAFIFLPDPIVIDSRPVLFFSLFSLPLSSVPSPASLSSTTPSNMVHTRGQGARPEGFSEYVPPKRERRFAIPKVDIRYERPPRVVYPPSPPSPLSPPSSPPHTHYASRGTGEPKPKVVTYKDASTQTDIDLTNFPETPTGKRRREAEEEAESSSKRARKLLTPQPPKHKPFFTSSWRTRSALSVPPKISILDSPTSFAHNFHSVEALHESPYYTKILKPTDDKEEKITPRKRMWKKSLHRHPNDRALQPSLAFLVVSGRSSGSSKVRLRSSRAPTQCRHHPHPPHHHSDFQAQPPPTTATSKPHTGT